MIGNQNQILSGCNTSSLTTLAIAFKAIDQSVVNVIRPYLPSFKPRHHSILWSLPGGGDQYEHSDFHKTTFPRFAAILSLDDSTKLDIRNAENEWITVTIPRGEMLVFRGDFIKYNAAISETLLHHPSAEVGHLLFFLEQHDTLANLPSLPIVRQYPGRLWIGFELIAKKLNMIE